MELFRSLFTKKHYTNVAEESDEEEGKPFLTNDVQLAKLRRQLRTSTRLCILFFVSTVVLLLLLILRPAVPWSQVRPASSSASKSAPVQPGVDLDSILRHHAPHFPLTVETFPKIEIDDDFDPYNKTLWEQDVPVGRGFVTLPNGDGSETIWGVAAMHQLHCVYGLQNAFARAIQDPSSVTRIERIHVFHCSELLRQVVRCAADPTLDPAFPTTDEDGLKTYASFGWGGTHICRDYDQLITWASAHHAHSNSGQDPVNID